MKQAGRSGAAAMMAIFCVFIMSVFTTLILGVRAYHYINEASVQGYDERVGLSYIWTKIKTGDDAGRVYTREFHGMPALFIDEEYDGVVHHTAIYHYDGWIYELFFEARYEFHPRDGVPIVKNEALLIERLDNGLIKVSTGEESLIAAVRTGPGNRE